MNCKKIARPLNNLKNEYLIWLKKNSATNINVFRQKSSTGYDYNALITAFIEGELISLYLKVYKGFYHIEYQENDKYYLTMSIDDFKKEILYTPK